MNNDRIDTYFYIFIITIFSLLLFGTVVSSILKKTKPDNETFQKVFIIVRSWWYIATPIIISFLLGAHAVLLLFFFVTCFIAIEFTRYLSDKSMQKPMRFVLIATTLLQYLAILKNWNTAFYAFIPLVAIWVLPLVIFISKNPQNLPRTAALVLGSLLMSYYISHVPAMPLLQHELWQSEHQALLAVLVLIFITETNDIFQFLSGKAFGKKKLVPEISPNKTEAGFIGGLFGTTLLFGFIGPNLLDLSMGAGFLIGLMVSVSGIFGDLLFSSLKRYYGIKDFSNLIPGHGGILDRIDSLVLTAPLYFHLIYFFKAGVL